MKLKPRPRSRGTGRMFLWVLSARIGRRTWVGLCFHAHRGQREARRCRQARKAGRRLRRLAEGVRV